MEGQPQNLKVMQKPSRQTTKLKRLSPSVGSRKGKNPKKRGRTKQDFLDFCVTVLEYADYRPEEKEETKFTEPDFNMNRASPINDSLESNSDSNSTDHAQPFDKTSSNSAVVSSSSDDEAITCFCNKPFAGRPMIECGSCETWIHLSCAKIRRTHIPDVFICGKCRDASQTSRKSTRVRTENKKFKKDL